MHAIASTASTACGRRHSWHRTIRRGTGFTLIEVMIVVVVVSVLAAIALPSYQAYVQKGRRVDAKNAVLDIAAREEKYFATNNKYTILGTDLGFPVDSGIPVSANGASYYDVTITQTPASDYIITATPTGSQVTDPCFSYSINALGVQSNGASGGGANTTPGCW
jgi:type IV pilus assembly protein PilE